MPRRNSPHSIQSLADLSGLAELVVDKRRSQRAAAKKNRRNRHYEKLFIRHTLAHLRPGQPAAPWSDPGQDENENHSERGNEDTARDSNSNSNGNNDSGGPRAGGPAPQA